MVGEFSPKGCSFPFPESREYLVTTSHLPRASGNICSPHSLPPSPLINSSAPFIHACLIFLEISADRKIRPLLQSRWYNIWCFHFSVTAGLRRNAACTRQEAERDNGALFFNKVKMRFAEHMQDFRNRLSWIRERL